MNLKYRNFLSTSNKSNRFLLKIFTTYFLVLIVPLLLGFIYYWMALSMVTKGTLEENTSILSQATYTLETRVEELELICKQIVTNPHVTVFQSVTSPFSYPHSYNVLSTRNSISNYKLSNKLLMDYFIFFNKSQLVLNSQMTYSYKDFYNLYLKYTDQTYEEWRTSLFSSQMPSGFLPTSSMLYLEKELRGVTYFQPLISYGKNDGFVMILIDSEKLLELISEIDISHGGAVYIQNTAGEILVSDSTSTHDISEIQTLINNNVSHKGTISSGMVTLSGKQMLVTRVNSKSFSFVCIQSKPHVLAKANSLRNVMLFIFFLSLLLGTYLSYRMSKTNETSINRILKEVVSSSDSNDYSDVFENLRSTFSKLQGNNVQLEKALEKQLPYLQNAFLTRLLRGDFLTKEEALSLSEHVNIDCENKSFCVIIFKFYSNNEITTSLNLQLLNTCKLSLKEALDSTVISPLYLDISNEQLALLTMFTPTDKEKLADEIAELIHNVKSHMPSNIHEKMFIYAGTFVQELTEIVRSYENASSLFYMEPSPKETSIIWYTNSVNVTTQYFYPADIQLKISNYVIAVDKDNLHNLLHELFTINLINNNIPTYLQEIFVKHLQSTLIQIANSLSLDEQSGAPFWNTLKEAHNSSLLQQIQITTELFYMLCDIVNHKKNTKHTSTISDIKSYIDANYRVSNLSLSQVADNFHLSESYLSYIFKQYNSMKFSTYLEELRLEKAKELLRESDLSINEISEFVGYISTNSFCRAFKRYAGMNTTAYRSHE